MRQKIQNSAKVMKQMKCVWFTWMISLSTNISEPLVKEHKWQVNQLLLKRGKAIKSAHWSQFGCQFSLTIFNTTKPRLSNPKRMEFAHWFDTILCLSIFVPSWGYRTKKFNLKMPAIYFVQANKAIEFNQIYSGTSLI